MIFGLDSDVVLFVTAIVLVVGLNLYFQHRSRVAQLKMLKTLEKMGQKQPSELSVEKETRNGTPLQYGALVILLCIAGVLATFTLQRESAIAAFDHAGVVVRAVASDATISDRVHLVQLEGDRMLVLLNRVFRVD
ncbi:MAG: hypothetical protein KGL29_05905 [Alphaproteobacteria bacterium]|nr:hypothetical protein [Alphaproteobacteria bacterium]MDE2265415.1 hypothetical protein [Alphaproteobacteria bacterium]